MHERLPVEITFYGTPFDRQAVIHTLRHLAIRSGWTITSRARHRIIYATTEDPDQITAGEEDVVILSTPSVNRHLRESRDPFPVEVISYSRLPFPHPKWRDYQRRGWIPADVLAGACAVMNLWYESRTRSERADDWILFAEDWWLKAGWKRPEPVVDQWLDTVAKAAELLGWPRLENHLQPTVLLTHDVDYLPTTLNRGFPRFLRSLARQVITRGRPGDALLNVSAYVHALMGSLPYSEIEKIADGESARGLRSSFQLVVGNKHHRDPTYNLCDPHYRETLCALQDRGFEICLHGSYQAGDQPARLADEKAELEGLMGRQISGHRQHYLHFHPASFFLGLEKAGFSYDMSVGYNDMPGPRAGTYHPWRPYDLRNGRHFEFWEIPLILMDTTLATTCRLSPQAALKFSIEESGRFMDSSGGCASIIWHQEQLGGRLDPGYDQVYWDLLDVMRKRQVCLTTGSTMLPKLEDSWQKSIRE